MSAQAEFTLRLCCVVCVCVLFSVCWCPFSLTSSLASISPNCFSIPRLLSKRCWPRVLCTWCRGRFCANRSPARTTKLCTRERYVFCVCLFSFCPIVLIVLQFPNLERSLQHCQSSFVCDQDDHFRVDPVRYSLCCVAPPSSQEPGHLSDGVSSELFAYSFDTNTNHDSLLITIVGGFI